ISNSRALSRNAISRRSRKSWLGVAVEAHFRVARTAVRPSVRRDRPADEEISMEKAIAARIMEAALSLGKEINNLDSLVSQLDNAAEKEEFVRALGNIMSIVTR